MTSSLDRELIQRLQHDHPKALLIPMTVIPFANEEVSKEINDLVQQVAQLENLTVFDIYPRYDAELKKGPNMLNYRRYPLAKIPQQYHDLVKPFVKGPSLEADGQRTRSDSRSSSGLVRRPASESCRLQRDRRRNGKISRETAAREEGGITPKAISFGWAMFLDHTGHRAANQMRATARLARVRARRSLNFVKELTILDIRADA